MSRERLLRLRALLMITIIMSMLFGQVSAVFGSVPGSTVMVTAGEASAETFVTPEAAEKKENEAETRAEDAFRSAGEDPGSLMVSGGNGEEKPVWETIEINDLDDLIDLAKNCSTDTWSEYKYVRLNADINVFESGFTTIPIFNGVFNGQGHQITEYTYSGDGYVTGLFRYIGSDGIVQDLKLYGSVDADNEEQVTGGICGINYGVIKNCDFFGSINGKTSTGGIAAINEVTGLIGGCRNHGKVTGYYYTGGVCGKNYGTISDTINDGDLNNSEAWVNKDDEMNTGSQILKNIKSGDKEENPLANTGIDTGGIAGYSKGSIIRCRNKGVIGYEHTGYNVGGIAGRQTGIISMCTNEGRVLGRKDIGGIAGQMEPHLEPDEVQSLTEAVDKLHDLIKLTIDDADGSVDVIKDDVNRLSNFADGAVDTTNVMSDQFSRFMNSNLDTLNTFMTRTRYVMNHVPAVFDDLEGAALNMSGFNNDLKKIMLDIDIYGQLSANETASVNNALRIISENSEKYNDATRRMEEYTKALAKAISDNDLPAISENSAKLAEASSDATEAAAEIARQLDVIYDIMQPHLGPARESLSSDIARANSHMNATLEKIRSASRSTRSIFDYLNSQSELKATKLGGDWDNSKSLLHDQLNGVVDAVNALSEHSSSTSHRTNDNFSAVNDQLNTVFHILADDIDGLGAPNKTLDELYTDVSDLVIEQIRSGRVDGSVNAGRIEGDINIGGIAGSMDIDENDPESSAAGTVGFKLGEKYLLRNVICDSRNTGDVISKKDGAGSIVGYMAQGIVTACQGRGYIRSTEGGYVGGIAGQSLSIVRNCDVLAVLSGSGYVGGIAGFGTTITGCIAVPTFVSTGDRTGSIAGQVERDKETQEAKMGVVSSNYFAGSTINGIDSINYTGIAEPVDYGMLLRYEGAPEDFRHLTISYRLKDLDDNESEIGTQEMPYGAVLRNLSYPDFEEKDGYYVEWDDTSQSEMTGNRVVNGEYVEIVTVIESGEKYPDTEKPLVFMDGSFERESAVEAHIAEGPKYDSDGFSEGESVTYEVIVKGLGQANRGDYKIRLYNPYDKADLYYYDRDKEKFYKCENVLERSHYLETDNEHIYSVYAVVEKKNLMPVYIGAGACALVLILVLILAVRGIVKALKRVKNKA